MTKEQRIENKRAELMEVYAGLSENELKIAAGLIDQAAFLGVTLEDLAESITKNGTIEEYTNGKNQSGRKISSDAKLYNSLIAKYTAITTKLLQIIPKPKESRPALTMTRKPAPETEAEKKARERSIEREQAAAGAFKAALDAGQQFDYPAFCEQWEKEHSA